MCHVSHMDQRAAAGAIAVTRHLLSGNELRGSTSLAILDKMCIRKSDEISDSCEMEATDMSSTRVENSLNNYFITVETSFGGKSIHRGVRV